MNKRPIIKVAICAECGQQLHRVWLDEYESYISEVAAYINGEAYCYSCLLEYWPRAATSSHPQCCHEGEEADSLQQKAIRILEDG
ncbi:MAG: hypothetical protein WBH86_16950 [Thermogutta sp.]